MKYFMVMYLVEGWAAVTGILHQPLYLFCSEVFGWKADAVGNYVAVLGIPWVIKPLYGLISDTFPLLGYRRKSYLILLNSLAVVAFAALIVLSSPGMIIVALTVITVAMAASSALCGALLVENGKSTGHNAKFCSQQTLWANLASITAALIGGWLCAYLGGRGSMHWGALITMFAPIAVVVATCKWIDEEKTHGVQLKAVGNGVKTAVQSPIVWLVSLFLVLWAFNPGFGAPLFFHMKDNLHFSQSFIGTLAAWFAGGAAVGAILFRWLSPKLPMNLVVLILIIVGAIVQYCFVFMASPTTATVLNVLNGALTASAGLAVHVVAANKCPKGAEGFVYGLLISLTNASYFGSQAIGGNLYVNYLHSDINSLIAISAGLTLTCLVVLPFINFSKEEGPTWFRLAYNRMCAAK